VLAVDTASRCLSVAVQRSDTVVSWTGDGTSPDYGGELVPRCEALLRRLRATPDCVTEIVVNRGPGSFTGVRIGMTFTRVIAAYTRARVYAADTFGMLLQGLEYVPAQTRLIVVCSAVKHEVYLREFRVNRTGHCVAGSPACETAERFRLRCAKGGVPALVVAASDVGCIPDGVRGHVLPVQRDARQLLALRSAPSVISACVRPDRIAPATLAPLYIRSTYYT
jgi:tRNA threonylcarbamoyl adenosine modification protein YeaZ